MTDLFKCKLTAINEIAKFIFQKKLKNKDLLNSTNIKLELLMRSLIPREEKEDNIPQSKPNEESLAQSKKTEEINLNELEGSLFLILF